MQLAVVVEADVDVGVLNSLVHHRIDDATDDVVGGILVLVVLVSVRVGHRSEESPEN